MILVKWASFEGKMANWLFKNNKLNSQLSNDLFCSSNFNIKNLISQISEISAVKLTEPTKSII